MNKSNTEEAVAERSAEEKLDELEEISLDWQEVVDAAQLITEAIKQETAR